MNHVVTFNGRHWPATQREDGLLVDLRLFASGPMPKDQGMPPLVYDPARLAEAGVPAGLIADAAESRPQGFVLLA